MSADERPRGVLDTGEHEAITNMDPSSRDLLVRIDERTRALDTRYVRRDEFLPIQKIVYGLAAMAMITIFGALLALIIRR